MSIPFFQWEKSRLNSILGARHHEVRSKNGLVQEEVIQTPHKDQDPGGGVVFYTLSEIKLFLICTQQNFPNILLDLTTVYQSTVFQGRSLIFKKIYVIRLNFYF